jgi:MYXO-CTERM domain-containing protein
MKGAAALAIAMLLVLHGCSAPIDHLSIGTHHQALGIPQNGFPSWEERVILVLTNRARSDPGAESDAICGGSCSSYAPSQPLEYSFDRGRAARFQSTSLLIAGSGLMHDSVCTLATDLGSTYPDTCDGSPSCACQGGSASCSCSGGSPYCTAPDGLTAWNKRVNLFGVSANGENAAAGNSDPVKTFSQWVKSSGHWSNINKSTHGRIGTGHFGGSGGCWKDFWVQVFASGTVTEKLPGGAHHPRTGTATTTFKFWANYLDAGAPQLATVNVDGTCYSMTLERGSNESGTFLKEMSIAQSGCLRYYFYFRDSTGAVVTYPSTGSFGVGVGTTTCEDYDAGARPSLGQGCGGCTADAECDDANPCTQDACSGSKCENTAIAGCCTLDTQCADADACTQDACVGNTCENTVIAGCCTAGAECDDGNACTEDRCSGNTCQSTPIAGCCTADAQCDDGEPCTQDSCSANKCQHPPISGCCTQDAECDDSASCTTDACVANKCEHAAINGCCAQDADCADNNPCTQTRCELPAGNCSVTEIPGCCAVDTDCDDGDPCTDDSCGASNTCEHVARPGCGDPVTPGQAQGPFFDADPPATGDPPPESGDDPPPVRRAAEVNQPLVGGCSVGGAPPPWGAVLVVALLLGLVRRRYRY